MIEEQFCLSSRNHFINLCFHAKDFGIKIVSYNFFATSHGKSVCDGIGAVIKRTVRKDALQGAHILNAKQMYDHLSAHESAVRYEFLVAHLLKL